MTNDQISSFKIAPGFVLDFFQNDNFGGWVYSATASDDCLDNEGRSDQLSSAKLRANGTLNLANRYFIKNRKSGLYMDVKDFSTANGAPILQWHFHGGTNQQFDFVDKGNGAYALRSVVSGKTIDIDAISNNNGAKAIQWDFAGGGNQIFVARKAEGNYYQLVATHSGKVLEIINGSLDPSAQVQQYDNNNQTTSHWELVPVDGAKIDYKREAEDFSSSSAVDFETTTDPQGGSRNVGWIDAGDWLAYTAITFPTSGYYKIEYRVASPNSGKVLSSDLNAGTVKLGDIAVPNTGGWQNWQTVSQRVFINAGTYDFGIFTATGGWNINWFRVVSD
ncbi:MAG: carbohydrate-binding protein [Moraxellaceae bacterium]|nr:MAG: carbohydrate-binding protein [Moraxellaceae bacterium]